MARPATVRADLAGTAALSDALGVGVPQSWPPELYDDGVRSIALKRIEDEPDEIGWWHYYVVESEPVPTLAGIVGYKGPPDADGTVEVGYAILPERQGRGIASEAMRALVERAFGHRHVKRVIAQRLPESADSSDVLEKLGFRREDEGPEPGTVRYVLERGEERPAPASLSEREIKKGLAALVKKNETLLRTLAIELEEIGPAKVVATMPVGPRVHQPFGYLHGGASVALAETVASIGAAFHAPAGAAAFGLEINANHVRPMREGTLRAVATPIHIGRTTQVWDIRISDERERLVCVSRCTIAVVAK